MLLKVYQRPRDLIKNVKDRDMACKIEIRQNLYNEIREKAKGLASAYWPIAQQKAREINKSYKFDVVRVFEGENDHDNKVVVNIPPELVNIYHAYFTDLEEKEARGIQTKDALRTGEEYTDDYLFQMEEVPASAASIATLAKVREVIEKMGISVQKLSDYLKGNPDVQTKGVSGLADLMRGIIAVAEGKEEIALTEEMVHVATAMLEQTNPKLVTEMISQIGKYKIYNKVLEAYKSNPAYQTKEGKPDIRKIKKEAADKLIAELIIYQNEGTTEFPELREEVNKLEVRSWWQKILDAIRGLYKKANVSIFEEAANKIISGEVQGEVSGEGVHYQISTNQEQFDRIERVSNMILNKLLPKTRVYRLSEKSEKSEKASILREQFVLKKLYDVVENITGEKIAVYEENLISDKLDKLFSLDLVSIWKDKIEKFKEWSAISQHDYIAEKRTLVEYLRRGIESIKEFSPEQQELIRKEMYKLTVNATFKSKEQQLFLMRKWINEKYDKLISKQLEQQKIHNFKRAAIIKKYQTLVDFAEMFSDYKERIRDKILSEYDRIREYENLPKFKEPRRLAMAYDNSGFFKQGFGFNDMPDSDKKYFENSWLKDIFNKIQSNLFSLVLHENVIASSNTVDILNKIIKNNTVNSDLAQSLLVYAKKHNVSINLVKDQRFGSPAGVYHADIEQREDGGGSYIKNDFININYDSIEFKKDPEKLILHEIVHSLSVIYVTALKHEQGTNNAFRKYMDYVQDYIKEITSINTRGAFQDNPYGFTDEAEFVSEILTNSKFKELLRLIPPKDSTGFKNLFEQILDAIAKLFGLKKYDSAYTQLHDIVYGVMEIQKDFDLYGEKELKNLKKFNLTSNQISAYQLSDPQKKVQESIMYTQDNIRRVESKDKTSPFLMDADESNNWYERKLADGTWERIKKRVTDRVKDWYKQKFPDKEFTEEEKASNEFKRKQGLRGHAFFQNIHNRYFDSRTGERRDRPLDRPEFDDPADTEVYIQIERHFIERMNDLFKDGKTPLVFSEVIIYDPKQKEAGTIDLLVVDENGKSHVFDWKFMAIGEKQDDVAWYKQKVFEIQLDRYRDILKDYYGVKEIGMIRAIPVLMRIGKSSPSSKEYTLTGINVGSVDATQIKDLRLLPVASKSESTGNRRLNNLIEKLNAALDEIGKEKVTTEEEREYKIERLNVLRKAIRAAQVAHQLTPIIGVIRSMRKEGISLINEYEMKYKDKSPKSEEFKDEELSEFADRLRDYKVTAEAFGTVDQLIDDLIYNPEMDKEAETDEEIKELEYRKEVLRDVIDEARSIRKSGDEIEVIKREFADRFVGWRNNEAKLLTPEVVVKGLTKNFNDVSDLGTAALNLLVRLSGNARLKAMKDSTGKIDELLEIRNKLAARGGDLRSLIKRVYQKDSEGKFVNKLIYQYSKEFFDAVRANAEEGNRSVQWLLDNIDVEAYKEEANKILEDAIKRIESTHADEETKERLILQAKQKWDITRKDFDGFDNYVITRHPLQKWESKEYLEIKKDDDLLKLYNFIRKINKESSDTGYINNRIATTFLPWVRKGMAESLAWDFSLSVVSNWAKNLTLREGDVGYGKFNALSGEMENAIPKYYTHDFTLTETGERDTSDVSEDLFKNLIVYINHMEKYKYLSQVEGMVKIVRDVEKFKEHIRTTTTGKVVFKENGEPDTDPLNEKNFHLFDTFMKAVFYEQKYPLSDSDMALGFGKAINFVKQTINNVLGTNLHIEENPSATSLLKTIDALNRGFQLKTLGFELISGTINAFGANIQILTQAGNYFKPMEVISNEMSLLGNKFKSEEERESFVQLIDIFMPLRNDPSYERLKEAGLTKITRGRTMTDWLMIFMHEPEQHLEKSVFLTLLQNSIVVDGKIINIREYVKKKYNNRYENPGQIKVVEKQIENEIEDLKRTKSMYATKRLVDGKVEIPGLDLDNINEVQRLTNLSRNLSRNATGNMSAENKNLMNLNVWTRSMMLFKNWIPKLTLTRFGEFRKIADDFSIFIDEDGHIEGEKFDVGRVRLFFHVLGNSIRDKSMDISNILQANEKGILALDKLYEEYSLDYYNRTGEKLNMSKEDFYDLIRTNLANQMRELAMLLSLLGASISIGFIAPDDDDTRAEKNAFRFAQRTVDRFISELSFYYSPSQFQKLLSGSAFPALGLTTDITRAINHIMMEFTGLDISDPFLTYDEVVEKAQPIKNIARVFPFTKSLITYGAVISEDFAREFDVTIQKESRK